MGVRSEKRENQKILLARISVDTSENEPRKGYEKGGHLKFTAGDRPVRVQRRTTRPRRKEERHPVQPVPAPLAEASVFG